MKIPMKNMFAPFKKTKRSAFNRNMKSIEIIKKSFVDAFACSWAEIVLDFRRFFCLSSMCSRFVLQRNRSLFWIDLSKYVTLQLGHVWSLSPNSALELLMLCNAMCCVTQHCREPNPIVVDIFCVIDNSIKSDKISKYFKHFILSFCFYYYETFG